VDTAYPQVGNIPERKASGRHQRPVRQRGVANPMTGRVVVADLPTSERSSPALQPFPPAC
jgi:hypothetical protein